MAMDWNEGTISALREMWTAGMSTSEIGRRLGCSKNAVVGKAHRLPGLIARPTPIIRQDKLTAMRAQQRPEVVRLLREGYSADRIRTALRLAHEYVAQVRDEIGAPVMRSHQRPRLQQVPRKLGTSGCPDVSAPLKAARPVIAAPPKPRYVPRKLPGVDACCYPLGEVGTRGFRFCDAPDVVPGKPYCAEHCKEAFVKVRPIKAVGNTAIFL
jgi:GcrA cell cycle regulator